MKIKILKRCAVFSIILVVMFISAACSSTNASKKNISYLSPSYPVDISDPVELIGLSNNVFSGTVIKQEYVKERVGIPYTFFTVEVKDNIKGTLSGKVIVRQMGGEKDNTTYMVKDDTLLEAGSEYLLLTRYDPEYNAYTVASNYGHVNMNSPSNLKSTMQNSSENTNLIGKYNELFLKSTDYDSKMKKS